MGTRAVSDRILAHVEFITTAKPGEYGLYKAVLFLRTDLEGEAAKVWKPLAVDQADHFVKGQQVWLVPTQRKGKDTWNIELIDSSTPLPAVEAPGHYHVTRSPTAVEPMQLTPDQKRQIAQDIDNRSDLIGFCFQTVHEKFVALDSNAQTTAAIGLYRSACQKFNL